MNRCSKRLTNLCFTPVVIAPVATLGFFLCLHPRKPSPWCQFRCRCGIARRCRHHDAADDSVGRASRPALARRADLRTAQHDAYVGRHHSSKWGACKDSEARQTQAAWAQRCSGRVLDGSNRAELAKNDEVVNARERKDEDDGSVKAVQGRQRSRKNSPLNKDAAQRNLASPKPHLKSSFSKQ